MCAGASVVRAVQAACAVRAVSASSASVRRGRGVGRCLRGPVRRCPGCSSGQKVSFAACGRASSDHPGAPGRVRVRVRDRMRRVCSSGRTVSFAASGRTSSDHPGSRGGMMPPARRDPGTARASTTRAPHGASPHGASQHYASPARREHHGTTEAPHVERAGPPGRCGCRVGVSATRRRPSRACRGTARSPSGRPRARVRCPSRRCGPGRARSRGRRSAGSGGRSARP